MRWCTWPASRAHACPGVATIAYERGRSSATCVACTADMALPARGASVRGDLTRTAARWHRDDGDVRVATTR